MGLGGHLLKTYTFDSSVSGNSIGTSTYIQVDATGVGMEGSCVYCYNGGSQILQLGVGPASGESAICQIAPGVNQRLPVMFPKGRIALKSLTSTQSTGVVAIDVFA